MQIILDVEERSTVGIHNCKLEDFNNIRKMTGAKLCDLENTWMFSAKVGMVEINFFTIKEKCVSCKKANVDDPEAMPYCADCFDELEQIEARSRERDRREDAYDASRGH